MIQTQQLDDWEKHAIISFLLYRMSVEQRRELMTQLPTAYNKMVGVAAVEISFKRSDGLPIDGLVTPPVAELGK